MPILLPHIAYQRIKSFSLEVCYREPHQSTFEGRPLLPLGIDNILYDLTTDGTIDDMS